MIYKILGQVITPREAVEYALGPEDHKGVYRDVPPLVLLGNPDVLGMLSRLVYDGHFATTGVLAFGPAYELSEDEIRRICRRFLAVAYPGVEPIRVTPLFVRHLDHGHLHVHFVLPHLLVPGPHKYSPYLHKRDVKRFRDFCSLTSDLEGISHPEDPAHERLFKPLPIYAPAREKNRSVELEADLLAEWAKGSLPGPSEVQNFLSLQGFRVQRRGQTLRLHWTGKPITLAGLVARTDWDGKRFRSPLRIKAFAADRPRRLVARAQGLVDRCKGAAETNRDRFGGHLRATFGTAFTGDYDYRGPEEAMWAAWVQEAKQAAQHQPPTRPKPSAPIARTAPPIAPPFTGPARPGSALCRRIPRVLLRTASPELLARLTQFASQDDQGPTEFRPHPVSIPGMP